MTPCLQSDVYARCDGADLARQLSVSSREIPLLALLMTLLCSSSRLRYLIQLVVEGPVEVAGEVALDAAADVAFGLAFG